MGLATLLSVSRQGQSLGADLYKYNRGKLSDFRHLIALVAPSSRSPGADSFNPQSSK